jgi:hypothetical protein
MCAPPLRAERVDGSKCVVQYVALASSACVLEVWKVYGVWEVWQVVRAERVDGSKCVGENVALASSDCVGCV